VPCSIAEESDDIVSHKLEVAERRSPASYDTDNLITINSRQAHIIKKG